MRLPGAFSRHTPRNHRSARGLFLDRAEHRCERVRAPFLMTTQVPVPDPRRSIPVPVGQRVEHGVDHHRDIGTQPHIDARHAVRQREHPHTSLPHRLIVPPTGGLRINRLHGPLRRSNRLPMRPTGQRSRQSRRNRLPLSSSGLQARTHLGVNRHRSPPLQPPLLDQLQDRR